MDLSKLPKFSQTPPPPDQSQPPAPAPAEPTMKTEGGPAGAKVELFCRCGAPITPGTNFCSHCGANYYEAVGGRGADRAGSEFVGGGMWIAPGAKCDDAAFDVVSVAGGGLGFWVKEGLKVYTGKHVGLPQVRVQHGSRVKAEPVSPNERVLVEIDGEQPGILPATFEIVPAAVRLLV